MAQDDRLRFLLASFGTADGPGALAALVQEHSTLLLGTPGVASALVSDGEMDEELRLAVFRILVDEARMDMENRGRLGKRFIAEAADAIAVLGETGRLDTETRLSLVHAYAGAGVEAPEFLAPAVQERALAGIGPAGFPDDLDTQIEEFRLEFGNDNFLLHIFLNDLLREMSVPLQAAFVQHVAGRDEAWCGSLVLYWLLSPVPEVRLAAAGSLREQVQRGSLEPAAASTLRLIRTWVPTDEVMPVLDMILQAARPAEPPEPPALRPGRLLGSLPDGSGRQSFSVSLEGADGSAAAFILLKAGHGVKDAFLVRETEATEAMLSRLAEMSEARSFDLAFDVLEPALSAALAEGLAEGKVAPPGLIDVARACGFGSLRPRPMTARDWLLRIDSGGEVANLPAGERKELIKRSGDWPLDHNLIEDWFEGTAIVDEALEGVNGLRQLNDAALWAALGKRRGYWALLMVRAAHLLRFAFGDRDWHSFVVTATALIDGEALEGIPIMRHIFDTSVAAWREEERALDAGYTSEGRRPCRA